MRAQNLEPAPPGWKAKYAEHHWLEHIDIDGHGRGVVCLQWNPGAKRWSHSGQVGTGMYVDTLGWRYVAECPLPPPQEE
jgi:hypothetical protein